MELTMMTQTTAALSGLICLTLTILTIKKQLMQYARYMHCHPKEE